MKKLFVLTASVLLALSLVSCPGGLYVAGLHVSINVVGEDGEPVTQDIFDNLSCSFIRSGHNTKIYKGTSDSGSGKNYKFSFDVRLGRGRYNLAKLYSAYEEKMKAYGIIITDKSGKYKDFVMNPIPDKGYIVRKTEYSYPAEIEYTAQLKKRINTALM